MKNAVIYGLFYLMAFATLLMTFLGLREVWFLCCIGAGLSALVFKQRRFAYLFFFPMMLWVMEYAIRIIRFADVQGTVNPSEIVLVGFLGLKFIGLGLSFVAMAGYCVLAYKAIFSLES